MLAHKAHGAQKIADRFENVLGLAATTGAVDEWIYDALDQTYVQDETLRRRMAENNPHAYMQILEQMMEYSERGYWKATEEQLNRIRDIYMDMENDWKVGFNEGNRSNREKTVSVLCDCRAGGNEAGSDPECN